MSYFQSCSIQNSRDILLSCYPWLRFEPGSSWFHQLSFHCAAH